MIIHTLVDLNPHYLIVQRARPPVGDWTYVTGRMEAGETRIEAARREVREETRLELKDVVEAESMGVPTAVCADPRWLSPIFVAQVDRDVMIRLNAEHTAYRWYTMAEADTLLSFEDHRYVIRNVDEAIRRHIGSPGDRND